MTSVKFNLKKPNSESSLLLMIFNFDYFEVGASGKKTYKFLKVSTGESIKTKFWDNKNQKVRPFSGSSELIAKLTNLTNTITKVYRRMSNDHLIITPESLKAEYLNDLQEQSGLFRSEKGMTFFTDFIKEYIKSCGKRPNTIKGYNTTLNWIDNFQTHVNKKIRFEDINHNFYDDFISYLKRKKKAPNTIGKNIKNIKVFMNNALDRGLTDNKEHQNRWFSTPEEATESVYLTDADLSLIHNLNLTKNPRLDRVKDLFLVGCYTGLRFSDLSLIEPANIQTNDSGSFIRIKTQKTGETVVVPLHYRVKEILIKYNNELPRAITNQKMNDYLKELGEEAKINEEICYYRTRGNNRIQVTKKKHEMITVHTARRTFATNAYKAGMDIISIMGLTGHKTERAFRKYIKISQEENATRLINHPYFLEQLKIVK